jgi:hypothetical protein
VGAFHRLAPIGDGRFALATGLAPPGVCEDPDFTPEPSYPIRLPPLGGPAVSLIDIGDPALGTGFRLVQRLCGGGPTPTMAGYGPTVTGRLATFYRGRASLFDWNLPALATGGNALTRILDWQQERDAWGGLFHDVRMTEVPGGAGFLLHSYTHLAGLTADGPTGPLLGPLVSRLDGPQELFTLDSHLALLMSPGGATPTSRELQIQALPLQPGAPPLASLELPAGEGRLLQHQQLLVFVSRSCSTRPDGACAAGQSWQVFDLRSPGQPRPAGKLEMPDSWPESIALKDGLALLRLSQPQLSSDDFELLHVDLTDPDRPHLTSTALDSLTELGIPDAWYSLVADGKQPDTALYLTYRRKLGETIRDGRTSTRIQYLARRWIRKAGAWQRGPAFPLPGRLIAAWAAGDGTPLYLTSSWELDPDADPRAFPPVTQLRLSLLRRRGGSVPELLDSRTFEPHNGRAFDHLLPDGDRLFVAGRGWSGSGHLLIFDVSGGRLRPVHDAATSLPRMRLQAVRGNHLLLDDRVSTYVVDVTDPARPRAIKRVPAPATLDRSSPVIHHRASSLAAGSAPLQGPPEILLE